MKIAKNKSDQILDLKYKLIRSLKCYRSFHRIDCILLIRHLINQPEVMRKKSSLSVPEKRTWDMLDKIHDLGLNWTQIGDLLSYDLKELM